MVQVKQVPIPVAEGFNWSLLRPRFLYVWVQVFKWPIPIFLVVPLSLVHLGLWIAQRVLSRKSSQHPTLKLLQDLHAQAWQLRQLPPFALVDAEINPLALQEVPDFLGEKLKVKLGLW